MNLEPQTVNGDTLSRLRRTLTMPLNKIKSRSSSFREGNKYEDDSEILHKYSNRKNRPKKRRGSLVNSEHEIQISKPVVDTAAIGEKKEDTQTKYNVVHVDRNIHDLQTAQPVSDQDSAKSSRGLGNGFKPVQKEKASFEKSKRKISKRWPTTTLARVLERFQSHKKNHHTAAIVRNVTILRKTGESLGIFLKEVPITVEQSGTNTSRQDSESCNKTDHQKSRILISRLERGCAAEKQGLIKIGDEVLFVNYKDITKKTIQEVAAMMDHDQTLVLCVRSKYLQINNNNNNEKEFTSSCKCDNTIGEVLLPQTDVAVKITHTDKSKIDCSKVPECTSTSLNINHNNSRDGGIPSVYDNDFSALYPNIFDVKTRSPRPKQKIETEFDEALQILMKAIDSFEKPSKVSPVFWPKSYRCLLDEILLEKSENGTTVAKSENDDLSCDSTNTSLSNTPQFPSVSELPVFSDPEYDDVATTDDEETAEEIQVDGSARLFSAKTNSSSSNTNVSVQSANANDSSSPQMQISKDANSSCSLVVGDDGKIDNSLLSSSESNNRQDRLDRSNEANVEIEIVTPASDSTLFSTAKISDRPIYKTSLSANACITTVPQNERIIYVEVPNRSPNEKAQPTKNFWSKVTSPPRLRKNRIRRKISKRMKKIENSEGETGDPSSNEMKDSILDRYHLDLGEDQRRLSSMFFPDNRSHDSSVKSLNLAEFRKYKPPSSPLEKNSQIAIKGSLVITLYGARDIKKTVSEVYCIAQIDDDVQHRIRTRMQPCRGSVAWNDCYEAKLEDAYELHVTLYNWESHGKHKTLAKSTLPVAELLAGLRGVPVKLAVKLEPRGTLYVKLSVEDPSSLAGPKVFGADLQSILDREKSGLNIPLIVRDCIKEVEARGMSIVGIYRLCGSAIAKRELRKKYETDPKSVDLSPENYPDINVITGILKDFLRELPQPLFPPELLEAVTVAMEKSTSSSSVTSVSSPFDPTPEINFSEVFDEESPGSERNSALMNLLEVERKVNLPFAERATLYALLNHLKKVSTNHAQNKMTCQNLAVCFGPVLLGSINMGPSKGLDLTAAIGFKRHIQVLNYMVSNWPCSPVPLLDWDDICLRETEIDDDDRSCSKKVNRVSLTRRISYILPLQNGSNRSSTSGSVNMDMESRTNVFGKLILNNSRKSGSLTNILESNDNIHLERVFDEDGYFKQDDRDILLGRSNDDISLI